MMVDSKATTGTLSLRAWEISGEIDRALDVSVRTDLSIVSICCLRCSYVVSLQLSFYLLLFVVILYI